MQTTVPCMMVILIYNSHHTKDLVIAVTNYAALYKLLTTETPPVGSKYNYYGSKIFYLRKINPFFWTILLKLHHATVHTFFYPLYMSLICNTGWLLLKFNFQQAAGKTTE